MCLSLVGLVIVTRIIGPESYGAYTAAFVSVQNLQIMVQTGVAAFLIRRAAEVSEREYRTASTFLLAVTLLLVIGIEVGADAVGVWVLVPGFSPLLRALALVMPLQSLGAIAGAQVDRALNFRQAALIELSSQVVYYVVAVPLALMGQGAWSLVFAWIVQQSVSCALLHIAARYVVSFAWDQALISRMASYSLQYSAATSLGQLRAVVKLLIVGHFLGAESVAYVGLAVRVIELLSIIRAITVRLSLAAFGRIQSEPERLLRAINEAMQLQTLAIGPLLLAFSWVGGAIMLMISGERWSPVIDLFPYIALSYLTNAQFNMHVSALQALNRNLPVFLYQMLYLLILAPACAVMINEFGLIGYGWAEIVALPSYLVLHFAVIRIIGPLQYRVSLVWWVGVSIGLFWHQLGYWAMSAPFLALLFPGSIRQIRSFLLAARAATASRKPS
jgi:PST family polysaccharide transporter